MGVVVGVPVLAALTGGPGLRLAAAFTQAGAFVFGGGHAVLPLLEGALVAPGHVSADQFVVGYGLAQAVPGPMFSVAAYLGAVADVGPGGLIGALVSVVAIFLPGFLLVVAVLPSWDRFRSQQWASGAMAGAAAAVIGVLLATLTGGLVPAAVGSPQDVMVVALCLVLAWLRGVPVWAVVAAGVCGSVAIEALALAL